MSNKLSQKEMATNAETFKHILNVQKFIQKIVVELINRGNVHDQTKTKSPEVEKFTELTPKLAGSTYDSPEYKNFLAELKSALDHHYAKNRHHPEHFPNGVNDMTLVDLVEMLCDWKAASLRHNDGNILTSIEKNTERFNISEQLAQIFKNTVEYFDMIE